jgi:hypothetical protein
VGLHATSGRPPAGPRSKESLVIHKDNVRTRAYATCDELRTCKKMGSCNCAIAAINILVSKSQQRLITTSTLYLSRWWAPRPGQSLIGLPTKALKWRLHSQAMGPVSPHGLDLGQGQNFDAAAEPEIHQVDRSRQFLEPPIRRNYSGNSGG